MAQDNSRKLFIHAGTHKTGSTSIQLMLRETAQIAAEAGTKVIRDLSPSSSINCTSIAHAFIRPELWTATRIIGVTPSNFGSEGAIDFLIQQIRGGIHERFILSAEALCYMRTRRERQFLRRQLDRLNCEIVPIVYLRDVAAWKASWETQLQKMDRTRAFRTLHPDKFDLLGDWYFDTDSIIKFWRAISPLAVFPDYDCEVQNHGSVIPSFLKIVGLPETFNSDRYFVNRRPEKPRLRLGATGYSRTSGE